ncbi:unnamed protein product [Prunus brigantina]
MGLLTIIQKIKRKEKEICIVMVGLENSDKTIIVLRINGKDTKVGVAKISPLGLSPKQIGEDNAKEAAKDWNGNIKLTVQQMQQAGQGAFQWAKLAWASYGSHVTGPARK